MYCDALGDQIGEECVHSFFIFANVEHIHHNVFVVFVLNFQVVHTETNLADVEILSRVLKSMQELILIWELLTTLRHLNIKLVNTDLGFGRAPRF